MREVIDRIRFPRIPNRVIRRRISPNLIPEKLIGIRELGPEPLIQHIHHAGQRNFLILNVSRSHIRRPFDATRRTRFQRDPPFADLLQRIELQPHIVVQIQPPRSLAPR